MAEIIRMPLLSDTMKEGVIANWTKQVGDKVKSDDVIAEVETDKAVMEVMPYVDGTLLYVAGGKGVGIPVNGIMAIVGEEGEDIQSLLDSADNAATASTESSTTESANSDSSSNESAAPAAKDQEKESVAFEMPEDVTVVRMPLLSDTMKEGKIVSWLKSEGDEVKSDDVLAEVETDKATMEVMGYADGNLLHIGIKAGEAAKINEIIAIVGPKGTDISGILAAESAPKATEEKTTAPAAQTAAASTTAASEKTTSAQAAPSTPTVNNDSNARMKISPLARKIAEEKGINISAVSGTGDGGRIIKRDIDNFVPAIAATASEGINAVPTFTAVGQEGHIDTPNSQMRKVIAQRLAESKFQAPHFYLRMSIKMDNAMAAREAMNVVSPNKISFNDYVVKAAAMALRLHPGVNSSWMGDFIRANQHIHIGTAVAVEEGLIVPVVKFADQKSLSQIAADTKELIGKAKSKKLQPHEFSGNTFTISNLGMMDIDDFTAIINPPDSCILAVGKIEPTPVVEHGDIVIRQIMRITLSCDHRVVDGAVGAAFLNTLKSFLENPVNMLV